ncbi:hypothetical protein SK128_021575, partial [Halocaridina rubra]
NNKHYISSLDPRLLTTYNTKSTVKSPRDIVIPKNAQKFHNNDTKNDEMQERGSWHPLAPRLETILVFGPRGARWRRKCVHPYDSVSCECIATESDRAIDSEEVHRGTPPTHRPPNLYMHPCADG